MEPGRILTRQSLSLHRYCLPEYCLGAEQSRKLRSLVARRQSTMRVDIIGHCKPCMTGIFLHIDARMADYIHTHPYYVVLLLTAQLAHSDCALTDVGRL